MMTGIEKENKFKIKTQKTHCAKKKRKHDPAQVSKCSDAEPSLKPPDPFRVANPSTLVLCRIMRGRRVYVCVCVEGEGGNGCARE